MFLIGDLILAKQIPDGRPLEAVRVTFPSRAMAEREARVLLDIGATVLYFAASGDWEQLTDGG